MRCRARDVAAVIGAATDRAETGGEQHPRREAPRGEGRFLVMDHLSLAHFRRVAVQDAPDASARSTRDEGMTLGDPRDAVKGGGPKRTPVSGCPWHSLSQIRGTLTQFTATAERRLCCGPVAEDVDGGIYAVPVCSC